MMVDGALIDFKNCAITGKQGDGATLGTPIIAPHVPCPAFCFIFDTPGSLVVE